MSDEAATEPTLETLSKQLEDLGTEMRAGFGFIREELSAIKKRMDIVEAQLVQMDARNNDRQEGLFHLIRSEMLGLRADFKEFRSQFKAPA